VITEDDVMRLLERADPARRVDAAPSVDGAGSLATLRTGRSEVTLIDTEPTRPQPNTGRRWPFIAAAAAVVAIVVSVLWLEARNHDPSNEVPAGTTVTPGTAAPVRRPLVEGYYHTPELTREQLIAAGVAAGFDAADVEAHVDRDGIVNTVTWDLRLADGHWQVLYGGVSWSGTYEVVDIDTVIATDRCGAITYDYLFDGEQLVLDMVDDQCDEGVGELIAQTVIYETAPFTLVNPAESQQPATTVNSVAGNGN
jgi:hypothetical protein